MRSTPTFTLLAAVALMAGAGMPLEPKRPATDQAARKAVERVTERYRTLKSYRLEGTGSSVVSAGTERNETTRAMRFVVQRPSRFVSVMRAPDLTTRIVADGESVWTEVPELGQYTVQPMAPMLGGADSAQVRDQLDPAGNYARLLDGVTSVQVMSRDTVRTARGVVPCERYALRNAAADSTAPGVTVHPRVVWVDPTTRMVMLDSTCVDQQHPTLGLVSSVTVTRMVVAEPDPALTAGDFTFKPEAGERRVRRFMRRSPEQDELEGQPASDFTLQTLADAKPVRLSSLKGRVVLLDFWATWCGPCRGWLPIVAKAHRDYAAKGLTVFAVNEREPDSKVRAYLTKQNLDLPVLMDTSGQVGLTYRANSIPLTVVVGRDGNVARVMVGLHDEEDLKDILHDLGID
jgi:thiol-disulfide isomerase/thioredoxin